MILHVVTFPHFFPCIHTAIFVGLSSLTYDATEGPNAVVSVCATIELALRPLQRDTSVVIVTPVTGGAITGNYINSAQLYYHIIAMKW